MIKAFQQGDADVHRIDVVIGCGLIGTALCKAICRRAGVSAAIARKWKSDWSNTARLAEQLNETASGFRPLTDQLVDPEVHFFWCAGRAGFESPETVTNGELENFQQVLRWAESCTSLRSTFHIVSSAGGLHEGQTRCCDPTKVELSRPYARLKIEQERLLKKSTFDRKVIYRPSSVFGMAKPGQRFGLIPTMIRNGLAHRSTTIFANANTQRDFVSADDVATFMANEDSSNSSTADTDSETPTIYYLVSGFPSTLWGVHSDLERFLGRDVPVTYTIHKDNFQSTTFSPSLTPRYWRCRPVKEHLSRLSSQLIGKPTV